jgi:hypothetical protein
LDRKSPAPDRVLGPDGLARTRTQEDELNQLFATLFRSAAGREVLSYLRAVTIEMVAGPEITDAQLRHREGSRYLVGIIEARVAKGKQNDPGEPDHPARRGKRGRRNPAS